MPQMGGKGRSTRILGILLDNLESLIGALEERSVLGPESGQTRLAPITMRVVANIPRTQYRDFVYLSYFFLLARDS